MDSLLRASVLAEHGPPAFQMLMVHHTRLQACPQIIGLSLHEMMNIQHCWASCMEMLTTLITEAIQVDVSKLAMAIAMCNTALAAELYAATRRLHAVACLYAVPATDYQEVTVLPMTTVPHNLLLSAGLNHQPMQGPWLANGTDFLDSTQVASMLKHHMASDSQCCAILYPWSLHNLGLGLRQKPISEQCHSGHNESGICMTMIYSTHAIMAVGLVGDGHWRGIFFHGTHRTIYAWDPYGHGFPRDVVLALSSNFVNWHVIDINITLQRDGCNCAFWVVWAIGQFGHWLPLAHMCSFGQYIQQSAVANDLHGHFTGSRLRTQWHSRLFDHQPAMTLLKMQPSLMRFSNAAKA